MIKKIRLCLAALLLSLLLAAPCLALQPGEALEDPVLEARAREISRNVRCLVCRGEDIDESNAELAGDLRKLVRERLVAGDTDDQVFEYLRGRYGDYVLMTPPVNKQTALLWLLPVGVFAGGVLVVTLHVRRRKKA